MPSANEVALAELLRECSLPACNEEAIAQYLAQRGVLVPAALSEAEAEAAAAACLPGPAGDYVIVDASSFKDALARLARGEGA